MKIKPRRWLRAIAIVVGVIAALFAALALYLHIIGRDIAPADFSDLALPTLHIAPEENAYTYFIKATEALVSYPIEKDWTEKAGRYIHDNFTNSALVAEVLTENEEVFNYLRQGIQYQECFSPVPTNIHEIPFPPFGELLDIMTLLKYKIWHEQSEGNLDSAIDNAHTLLRYGQLIRQTPSMFITWLVGLAIEGTGLREIQQLARDLRLSEAQLKRLLEIVSTTPPHDGSTQYALKAEFRYFSLGIDALRKEPVTVNDIQINAPIPSNYLNFGGDTDGFWKTLPLPRYFFLPNETQLLLANRVRILISHLPEPYGDMPKDNLENLFKRHRPPTFLSMFFSKNTFGKYLIMNASENAYELCFIKRCEFDGNLAATKIIIAFHLFERATGRRPQTLGELVPDFLPSVPLDPFDGNTFRYNPDKGVIYSVNTSLKDLGGLPFAPDTAPTESTLERAKDNPWKGDNAVFNIWE